MARNKHILYRRYARALLSLAIEKNILERSYEDMKMVGHVFSGSPELKIILKSPVIRLSKKQKILDRIFNKLIHPVVMRYLLLIAKKQRGDAIEGISSAYVTVYKQYLGIETVRVTTAVPIDGKLRSRALEAAHTLTTSEIEFEEEVNPEIIGGFILNLGEKQYNASVKHRYNLIRKHLNNS